MFDEIIEEVNFDAVLERLTNQDGVDLDDLRPPDSQKNSAKYLFLNRAQGRTCCVRECGRRTEEKVFIKVGLSPDRNHLIAPNVRLNQAFSAFRILTLISTLDTQLPFVRFLLMSQHS
jgi:hypothetical protein